MRQILAQNIMDLMREFLEDDPDKNYTGNYIGIVENNRDPEKMGRCQIRINGIHDDMPSENLQWAEPDFDMAAGIKGSFVVPEIGTSVNIYYNNGDIYQPRYFGKAIDKVTSDFLANKDEDYPDNVILYETLRGDFMRVNRLKGEFELHTAAGCILKMSQNGDIDIINSSSNRGNMKLNLRGDFTVDNRLGNTTLITSDCSVSAFGEIKVVSNEGFSMSTLGSQDFKTNKDFEVLSSGRTALKSKESTRIESNKLDLRGNTNTVAPATTGVFEFSFCDNKAQVPLISVNPEVLGGPFNCIPFDPLTGQPHQGRVVTGASILPSDPTDKIAEIAKQTAAITKKYEAALRSQISDITRKYASLDMQVQTLANAIGSTTLTSGAASEITSATALNASQLLKEISLIKTEYGTFLLDDVFDSEQKDFDKYQTTLTSSENIAKVNIDITGKTTIKDIVGAGKGLANDE